MAVFISNFALGRVKNEFASKLIDQYGPNAYKHHSALESIGISPSKSSYSYCMDILSMMNKDIELNNVQMNELYAITAKRHNVSRKRVFDAVRYDIYCSLKNGGSKTLISIFGEDKITNIRSLDNPEYVNDVLKYAARLTTEDIVIE